MRRGHRLVVGLSGGVDSVVLVDLLRRLSARAGFKLGAVHVNHQINPAADRWAAFCRAYCRRRRVPLTVVTIKVPRGASLEAAARSARYEALAGVPADFIAVAHNLDDQAETVLMQLLRGAGVKGLSAMPELRGGRPDAPSAAAAPPILRPLLGVTRSEIVAFARRHKLQWVEDDSNADTRFDRNFIRHRVLPVIAERFPAYRNTLLRASRNVAEAAQLLDELARADALVGSAGLNVAALRKLSAPRAKNVLRHYLASRGAGMPSATRLEECVRQIMRPQARRIALDMGACQLRVHGGELHVTTRLRAPARGLAVRWNNESRLQIPELGGTLIMSNRRGRGISAKKFSAAQVTVRARRGGERLHIHLGRPRRSLKNLLQEARVPPWLRDRLPLLYCGDELAAVPGIGIAVAYQARRGEAGIEPRWEADC